MTDEDRDLLQRLDRGQEANTKLLYRIVALLEHVMEDAALAVVLPPIAAEVGAAVFAPSDILPPAPLLRTALVEATGCPPDSVTAQRLGIFLNRRAGKTGAGFMLVQVGRKPATFRVIRLDTRGR